MASTLPRNSQLPELPAAQRNPHSARRQLLSAGQPCHLPESGGNQGAARSYHAPGKLRRGAPRERENPDCTGQYSTKRNIAVFTGKAKQVEILFADGNSLLVRGECQLRIQDERKFGIPTFSIRFSFQPGSGMMKEATGKFTFTVAPPQSTTVDLSGAVNRGFADEPEGKRGWTGQGADNDLRALPAGKLQAGNLTFDINPAGAVVVAGRNSTTSIPAAPSPFRQNRPAQSICSTPPHGFPRPANRWESWRFVTRTTAANAFRCWRDGIAATGGLPVICRTATSRGRAKIRNRSLVFTLQVSR